MARSRAGRRRGEPERLTTEIKSENYEAVLRKSHENKKIIMSQLSNLERDTGINPWSTARSDVGEDRGAAGLSPTDCGLFVHGNKVMERNLR